MGKTMSSYSSPNMDLSYMLNAAPTAKKMARTLADNEELPEAYNAIESGKLTTEVRQQGGWGTCWAFSGLSLIHISRARSVVAAATMGLSKRWAASRLQGWDSPWGSNV